MFSVQKPTDPRYRGSGRKVRVTKRGDVAPQRWAGISEAGQIFLSHCAQCSKDIT